VLSELCEIFKCSFIRAISKVLNPKIKSHLYLTRKTERSDSILPHSLRGVGPYAPYGPEATFRLPHSSNVVFTRDVRILRLAFVEDIANFGITTFPDHASDLTELLAVVHWFIITET
jgi:hypothetical protein